MELIDPIPYSLGIASSGSGTYTPSGFGYDYAIGGLPFLSAANHINPIVRQTAPFRKQQFDSQPDPGEQSLDGWWLRSQQSFHAGAGQLFGDPSASDASYSADRYYRSKGVNPWTPGQISLLPRVDTLTGASIRTISSDGSRAVGLLTSNDLFTVDPGGIFTSETPTLTGLPARDVTLDGTNYYMATGFEVWKRAVSAAPLSGWLSIYNFGGPSYTNVVVGWVKERLVLATDIGIYELTDYTSGGLSLPAPKWTPPQGTWIPTSVTESNSAIYVSGTLAGQRSIILKFTLSNTGSMPTLTSGTVVANLPQGETITSIFGYLGKFLAISTTSGPRIAEIDTNGDLTVGPLLFSGATGGWAARGQYLYASAVMPEWSGTEGGLVRIDLGLQLDALRFAYASDIHTADAGGGSVGVGLITAGLVMATGGGLFLESTTRFVDSGWLQSSRIRYSTLEPKIFKLVRSRGPLLSADYYVSVVDPSGNETSVVGYVAGQTPGSEDVSVGDLGPLDYLSVKFTLSSDAATNTLSAVTNGFQLKALPAQPRQRILQIPLYCFDFEKDRNGNIAHVKGSSKRRLLELEAIDDEADTVMFQELEDYPDAVEVSIDQVTFNQIYPPDGFDGFGGVITLTLRTV